MSVRLLIVDDHASTREVIRRFLMMPGMAIQECATGEEAVACAREFKPNWVTMDIQMPGMNGFESTAAIKQVHPDARVLIVSAYKDRHFHELARSCGATGFILKENILALRMLLESEMRFSESPSPLQYSSEISVP
ncbi:MAG TPA: response regulator transcription factor [Verrucomicrobiae bacterium]